MPRERAQKDATEEPDEEAVQVRCLVCSYFLLSVQEIGPDSRVVVMVICKSCKARNVIGLSPQQVSIGRI